VSGTVVKFWDTLKEIPQTSLTTLAVSLGVIVTLIVFERWIKAIPGGLVAVVGSIAISAAFDLASHGVSTLGPVPSGLPSFGLPSGVGWSDVGPLLATCVSMFLVILAQSAATSRAYAVKYKDRFVENNDLVGLGLANIAAGLTSTFVVNGSPTKTEMADEAKSKTQVAMLTMAVTVAIVLLFLTKPLQYMPNAVLSAVVFVIGVKLVDILHMRQVQRLRTDEFVIAAVTALVVVCVGVEQGIILAIVLSLLDHVRRHYSPHDAVIVRNARGDEVEQPVSSGARLEPGLLVYRFGVGLFYANASRFTEEVMALVDVPEPPRWFVLQADAVDDVDFTGGETLVEAAQQLASRGIVFAVADPQESVLPELDKFGLTAAIGSGRIFGSLDEAIAAFRAAPPAPGGGASTAS
jgi:MFS superfamily sulfate permease-like transporter